MFRHLSEGDGRLPPQWIASELAHLDRVTGDVEALADRIAGARTWTYVANRPDWLADAPHWAERTRAVEDRLSDALHDALTQRFVDRRTAVLLRDLKARGGEQRVEVDDDGAVAVEGEVIGRLDGFRFTADPLARAGEQRLLLAAAERHLVRRTGAAGRAADGGGGWRLPPRFRRADAAAAAVGRRARRQPAAWARPARRRGSSSIARSAICRRNCASGSQARLEEWFAAALARGTGRRWCGSNAARDGLSPGARGLIVRLVEALGALKRSDAAAQVEALARGDRQALTAAGVRLGVDACLRAGAAAARADALAAGAVGGVERHRRRCRRCRRRAGSASRWPRRCRRGSSKPPASGRSAHEAVRIDMVDRLARAIHGQREGRTPFIPDPNWAATAGLSRDGFARLMRALGYRLQLVDGAAHFAWRGHRRPAVSPEPDSDARTLPDSPFAILAGVSFGPGLSTRPARSALPAGEGAAAVRAEAAKKGR